MQFWPPALQSSRRQLQENPSGLDHVPSVVFSALPAVNLPKIAGNTVMLGGDWAVTGPSRPTVAEAVWFSLSVADMGRMV